MNSQHKIRQSEFRLPIGTRKHIRRLKKEGNLKEANLVRNAAIDHKNSVHQKLNVKLDGEANNRS